MADKENAHQDIGPKMTQSEPIARANRRLRLTIQAEKLEMLKAHAIITHRDTAELVVDLIEMKIAEEELNQIELRDKPEALRFEQFAVKLSAASVANLKKAAKFRHCRPEMLIDEAIDLHIRQNSLDKLHELMNSPAGIGALAKLGISEAEPLESAEADDPVGNEALPVWTCRLCDHTWQSRIAKKPAACPGCKRYHWDAVSGDTRENLTCFQCKFSWKPRGDGDPAICPKCRSPRWNDTYADNFTCPYCGQWAAQYNRTYKSDINKQICKPCSYKIENGEKLQLFINRPRNDYSSTDENNSGETEE